MAEAPGAGGGAADTGGGTEVFSQFGVVGVDIAPAIADLNALNQAGQQAGAL